MINYDDRRFRPVSNTENGETSAETVFHYRRCTRIFHSEESSTVLTHGAIGDLSFLEGPVGQPLLRSASEANRLLEECFAVPTNSVLLYAENLPPAFFDVSSQEAGAVLQKLRNYGVRLAVVAPPESVVTSRRFSELAAAERPDRKFGLFDTRAAALAWLAE